MDRPRARHALPVVLSLAAAIAASAHADQLRWLSRDDGNRGAAALRPGERFVVWISHLAADDGGLPTLYVARRVGIRDRGDHVELEADATRLAVGEPAPPYTGPQWTFRRTGEGRCRLVLDLAYVYVASREVPGMYVNLGKKLGLECEVRFIALELPPPSSRPLAHRPR